VEKLEWGAICARHNQTGVYVPTAGNLDVSGVVNFGPHFAHVKLFHPLLTQSAPVGVLTVEKALVLTGKEVNIYTNSFNLHFLSSCIF